MRYLYMMVGIPGSGKSTWVRNHICEDDVVVSRDTIRFFLVKETEEYFSREDEVFNEFIKQIQEAIDDSYWDIYIDATHLNEKARNKVLNRLVLNDIKIIPVYFDICIEEAIKRNNQREGRAKVPEQVIKNMWASLAPPTFKEKHKYEEIWRIQT